MVPSNTIFRYRWAVTRMRLSCLSCCVLQSIMKTQNEDGRIRMKPRTKMIMTLKRKGESRAYSGYDTNDVGGEPLKIPN